MNPPFQSNSLHEGECLSPKVGFRFHPTGEEIITYYLHHKMNGHDSLVDQIVGEIDLRQCEPWNLPAHPRIPSNDQVWHFFHRIDYKCSNSKRANRKTKAGFWKATGKIRGVRAGGTGEEIGTKRTLVFYKKVCGSKPVRTNWVIHEYQSKIIHPDQRSFVFCELKCKADEKADNSPQDGGEPSHPMDADVESLAEKKAKLAGQSHVCSAGVGFNDPSPLQSQMHPEQDLSDEQLLKTNCCDDEHFGLKFHDPNEDDLDPVKFADSFLALDEFFTEENLSVQPNDHEPPKPSSEVNVEDMCNLETEVGHIGILKTSTHQCIGLLQSFQHIKTSSLHDADASSKEYLQMPSVQTPIEPPIFGQRSGVVDDKDIKVIGGSINYIGSVGGGFITEDPQSEEAIALQEVSQRRIQSPDKISSPDKSFQDMEDAFLGRAKGLFTARVPEINCIELVGEEIPRLYKPHHRQRSGRLMKQARFQFRCSTVSTDEVRNLSCRHTTHLQAEKPDLNLGSSDDERQVSFICWENAPWIHRGSSPSVYTVNVLVGLVLLIFVVRELLFRS